jgi:site-specific recombinase XerD
MWHVGRRGKRGHSRRVTRPVNALARQLTCHKGLFADFHSCRHAFCSNLAKVGVSVKMAQMLARHSDVRLTLGIYTHVGLADCTAAIGSLPGPPQVAGAGA